MLNGFFRTFIAQLRHLSRDELLSLLKHISSELERRQI